MNMPCRRHIWATLPNRLAETLLHHSWHQTFPKVVMPSKMSYRSFRPRSRKPTISKSTLSRHLRSNLPRAASDKTQTCRRNRWQIRKSTSTCGSIRIISTKNFANNCPRSSISITWSRQNIRRNISTKAWCPFTNSHQTSKSCLSRKSKTTVNNSWIKCLVRPRRKVKNLSWTTCAEKPWNSSLWETRNHSLLGMTKKRLKMKGLYRFSKRTSLMTTCASWTKGSPVITSW